MNVPQRTLEAAGNPGRLRRITAFVRSESTVLGGIAVASGLLLAFLGIADEVGEGDTADFDNAILMAFRNPLDRDDVIGPLWVEEMVRDITALGSFACLGILLAVVVGTLLLVRLRGAALLALLAVLSGTVLSTVLKMAYQRPRPDLVHASREFTASFPSGHAMLSAVTFLTLGAILARLAPTRALKIFALAVAVLLTLVVGTSRVYMGVHFPSDVLAGWCLGAAWALLCSAIAVRLQRSGSVEAPPRSADPS